MKVLGRYALFEELASGGMATVHLGRLLGPAGFSRNVAIKRLHRHLAGDVELVKMLLDEARLAGRIQHPNVIGMLDVVTTDDELLLVMDFVHGESLARLLAASADRGARIPLPIAAAIAVNLLEGLHAAHQARGPDGALLGLIHRDVTPHNVMVRRDGTALVLDFGVAKAAGRFHTTEEGKIKGKLPYMAPEQLRGEPLTRKVDVFAAGAVLWEMLVGERAVPGRSEGEVLERVLYGHVPPPSTRVPEVPAALDAVVRKALDKDPAARFATAEEMARAVEHALPPSLPSRVAAWLDDLAHDALALQQKRLLEIEAEAAELTGNATPEAAELVARVASDREPTQPAEGTSAASASTESDADVSLHGASLPAARAPASSASSSTLAGTTAGSSAKGPLPWLLAALGLAAAAGGVLWSQSSRFAPDPVQPTRTDQAADSSSASSTAAPEIAPAASSPPVASTSTPGDEPSARGSATAPVAKAPARKPRAAPAASTKPRDCRDARQIDAQGRVTYKRECL